MTSLSTAPSTQTARAERPLTVLVTGAAGFIGSEVAVELGRAGHIVVGLDKAAAPTKGLACFAAWIQSDMTEPELADKLHGVDAVIHLAGRPGVSASWSDEFLDYLEANVAVLKRLLDACLERAITRVVFASSSSVYAGDPLRPSVLAPASPYGVTKLAAEQLAALYRDTYAGQLSVCAARIFTTYGPGQRSDMLFSRAIASYKHGRPLNVRHGGRALRDFVFVSDVAAALVKLAELPRLPSVIDIGTGESVTVNYALDLLATLGVAPELEFKDDSLPESQFSRARTLDWADLAWRPGTQLIDGLKAQIVSTGLSL